MKRERLVEFSFEDRNGNKIVGIVEREYPSVSGMSVAKPIDTTGEPIDPTLAKCAPKRHGSGSFAMGTVIALADRLAKRSA